MTDSNLTQLAEQAVRLLVAALPLLLPAAQKVAEGAAQKVGADLTDAARRKIADLWAKLRRQPEITAAAHDLAANPDDPKALAALRLQLKKALSADATLARELAEILHDLVIESRVRTGDVEEEGKVIGVEAKNLSKGKIKSKVKTEDVKGEVTGVKIHSSG